MNRKRPNWDKWLSRGNHLSQSESLEINFALAFEFDKLGAMQAAIVSIVYGRSVMHKNIPLGLLIPNPTPTPPLLQMPTRNQVPKMLLQSIPVSLR